MNKIKLSVVIIVVTLLSISNQGALFAQKSDTLSFLHISDIHLIFNLETFQKDLAQSRSLYENGVEPFKKFLEKVPKETGSEFVIATGDLIDIYEGETEKGGQSDFQAEQFARLLDKCNVPVYPTLGNHDITSYSWENGTRSSTQNCAEQARAAWIRNANCFKEGTYYSRNFNVGGTTYKLIFLDNAYNSFPSEANIKIPYIDKIQLYWLEDQLQQSADDIEIIMMHLPITSASDQQKPSMEFYSVLEKNPSVKLVLSGHNHKNAITVFPFAENNKITQVQTGGFGQNNENWRLIRLTQDKIIVSQPGNTNNEMDILTK